MIIEYRVLGPLEVLVDDIAVPVPAGRCRLLLATLLLRPNRNVSVDELIDRLWDSEPPSPDRAHKSLHMVVMRLRQALGDANCVRHVRGGYLAEVEPSQLDLLRFRELASACDFAAAVGLWRGPMLSDVASDALHQHDVPPVTEEWLHALERRIGADLATGRAGELVAELRSLTRQHPFREKFWGQLMLAFAQSGQQAQALFAYEQLRALLADELGVDPGDELKAVHQQVLSGSAGVSGPVPRQLPSATPRFVGRAAELRRLTELVGSDALTIAVITGTAGIGKTTLAVHWARGVADRFPDGQLYVNLRGFDHHREPVAAGDVLTRFLEALGVAAERIPVDLEARSAMYRSLVADRRIVVLLDNARDVEHVRPLLPGPCPSLVLITSRSHLTGLIVSEGAQHLALDVLTPGEAHALLVSRVGAVRADDADKLIRWCGGLPLALAIVAARAVQAPGLPLPALVAELADERTRLDTLDTGDAATSVRAVFQWSYQQLSPAAARMFRLAGVHPGPDITVPAAASLAGVSTAEARECVRELVRASLLTEHVAGRFTCHDLLRVYAADRSSEEGTAEVRTAAIERAFDHYLHTLMVVDAAHHQRFRMIEDVPTPASGTVAEILEDRDAIKAWIHAESAVLRAVIAQSDELGWHRHTWQLVWFIFDVIDSSSPWLDWLWIFARARGAASRLGERQYVARLLYLEGMALGRVGRFQECRELLEQSDHAYAEIGDVPGRVRAQTNRAWSFMMMGQAHEALQAAEGALELQRGDAGSTGPLIGLVIHQMVEALVVMGKFELAYERCLEWETANSGGATPYLAGLQTQATANVLVKLRRYDEAVETAHRSLDLLGQIGSAGDLAHSHLLLGDAHHGLGDQEEARHWWSKTLAAFEYHQNPRAEDIRAKLAALG
ncbi:BTAD domain-containing putative transcriptional regulator [Lentzea sp. NPDC005914]|uniref:AfsR/SARP family transcriptional regulator n=1 Tax=Lentzea sp. NPDC005914 TaxID=3154572 RepID=UPI003404F0F1